MEVRPIHTDADYRAALKAASAFFDREPEPGSEEGDRFEILVTLIQAWEARHFPLDLPDPIEAIKFRMEQSGLAIKDLEPMIGKSNRVYEVLNRKRPLTLAMIRRLHRGLGIPAEVLVAET
ncbi:helix-turn-helix domain-containing protein [Caenimonas aquaedulcis]|uniref:Transcriptional regulator n=1 Tax=Caenimonas aquaedulcis TaxID=2793270 RepID=A0A931ME19_9BURK|nr:transcriptional regulator [Caenimonas aquaedulcis]MBG9386522.1 transcriptional regulator [Caenimonas aquaedulcis]